MSAQHRSINVGAPLAARLLGNGGAASDEVHDNTALSTRESTDRLGRRLRRCNRWLACLLLLDALSTAFLGLCAYGFDVSAFARALGGTYTLAESIVDSLVVSIARWIALSTRTNAGWWVGGASCVLAMCKALVYGYPGQSVAASALVVVSLGLSLLELHGCARCIGVRALQRKVCELRAEAEAEAAKGGEAEPAAAWRKHGEKVEALLAPRKSHLRGRWIILRPYFWPTGWLSKLRTLATFFVMGGSKACNLTAPLYLGAAAQALASRRVPYAELATYCGLRFGSSALSELKRLVYIGVKQHAFAEIAGESITTKNSLLVAPKLPSHNQIIIMCLHVLQRPPSATFSTCRSTGTCARRWARCCA